MGLRWIAAGRRLHVGAGASLVGVALLAIVATASPAEAARRRGRAGAIYNPPFAAMVVDARTGRTLYAQNEDAPRHPASITKVMTLYLLFEQLEKGKLGLDSPLRVSAHAARQAPSKLGLQPGETITVEDAIKAVVTKSANDIAVTIAENLAGSEEEFAEQMTRQARALGMTRTVFRNASGLPNPEHVTTARDLTILARAIQERFPKYYPFFQTRVFYYAGRAHSNHNNLLGRVEGVDGIKTGFTNASGFNLMTNAKSDGRHIVAVVLGGRSVAARDKLMAALVESNLPRAYAGARPPAAVADVAPTPKAAPVAEVGPPVRPAESAAVAIAGPVDVLPDAVARPKPLDLSTLRPVVASAADAGSTTTPSTGPILRWSTGAQPLPQTAQAYAAGTVSDAVARSVPAVLVPPPGRPVPTAERSITTKQDERGPANKTVAAKAEVPPAPREAAGRPSAGGWVIQLGATDDEAKAKSILDQARSRSARALAKASAFTEKVTRDGTTLYRARFSGFPAAQQAEDACRVLKRSGFSCFAVRS
jgi:D-alanyl-D-alanine carboxypeptidase